MVCPVDRQLSCCLQAFCDLHPERKLVKKWVGDKIKELAERTLTGWQIKAEAPPAEPDEAAAAAVENDVEPTNEGKDAKEDAEGEEGPDPQSGAMLKFLGKVRVSLLSLVSRRS